MRHKQSTLKASSVHAHARRLLLDELDLQCYEPRLPAELVVSLLILASVWQSSLSGACCMVKDPPCREAAREAAHALLPRKPRELLEALLRALRNTLPDHLGRLPQVMALDLHQRPYYGKKATKGCSRRQQKQGTRNSFTYATIAVLTRWGLTSAVSFAAQQLHLRHHRRADALGAVHRRAAAVPPAHAPDHHRRRAAAPGRGGRPGSLPAVDGQGVLRRRGGRPAPETRRAVHRAGGGPRRRQVPVRPRDGAGLLR